MTDEQKTLEQPTFWTDAAGEADELGRGPFAKRIAEALINQPSDAGVVVALYGPWGSGKSTILHYVQEHIEASSAQTGQVVFVRFNPWFYNTEQQTVMDFFKLVADQLGQTLEKWNEDAGRRLVKLGAVLKGVSFSHAGGQVGGAVVEGVGSAIGTPRNLRERFDYLNYLLEDEPAVAKNIRIIVAIDDIDRTDAESIAVIFRLLKLGANLPRISYLLAFDEEVVATALGAKFPAGNADGTSFLEKIVQVPLHLPPADSAQLATILFRNLIEVLASHNVELSTLEQFELQSSLDSCVWPAVQTLRAGKQILNAVTFVIPVMRGEVHIIDQVLVECLRVLFPKVYKFVRRNKSLVLEWVTDKELLGHRASQLNTALKSVKKRNREHCKQLLIALFPPVNNMYVSRIDDRAEQEKWGRERRVCSASYFDRYFTYGLPFGDIFDAEVDAVVEGKVAEPAEALRELLRKSKPDLVVEKLIERSSTLRGEPAAALAGAVSAVVDQLPGQEGPLRFGSVVLRAAYLVTTLVQRVEIELRTEVLVNLLQSSDLRFAVVFFQWLENANPVVARSAEPLTANEIAGAGQVLATRLMTTENVRALFEDAPALVRNVISLCRRFGDGALAPQLVLQALEQSPDATINFLRVYMPSSQDNLPNSPFARAGYEYISGLVAPAKLMELLTQYFPDYVGPFDETTDIGRMRLSLVRYLDTPLNWTYRFAEIYRAYGNYAPLKPPSAYEPNAQKLSPFQNDHVRTKLQTNNDGLDFVVRVVLRVPNAIGLPQALAGSRGANLYGSPRENMLIDHLNRSGVTAWFRSWSPAPAEQGSATWRPEGTNSGETSTLVLKSASEEAGSTQRRRASLECSIHTGMTSAQRDGVAVEVPSMYVSLDLDVVGMGESKLALDDFAGVVLGMLNIIDTAEVIARSLLSNGNYTSGELACMFATGREKLDNLIDIESFPSISGNYSQKDFEVYSTLPILSIYDDPVMSDAEYPNEPRIRLAIEFVRMALDRAGKREYLDTLHQMLPRLAEQRITPQPVEGSPTD